MENFFSQKKAEPYLEPLEHISDICGVMRYCFESDNTKEAKKALDFLREREELTLETALPMVLIRKGFALSGFEYFCVMLGVSSAMEGNGAPVKFSDAILHYPFVGSENVYLCLLADNPLRFLLETEEGCGVVRCFRIREYVYHFVISSKVYAFDIFWGNFPDGLPLLHSNLHIQGVDFILRGEPACVVIKGRSGSGRRTLAAQICGSVGKRTFSVYSEDIKNPEELAAKLTAFCVITDSFPVIIDGGEGEKTAELLKQLTDWVTTVFICTSSEEKHFNSPVRKILSLNIKPLDQSARRSVWDFYLKNSDVDTGTLSERYHLTAGQIAEVCGKHLLLPENGDIVGGIMSLNSENTVCRLVHPMFGLNDVIVPERTAAVLRQIVKTAESMPALMEKHGFKELFPYGRGLGVLFYGAPGTGKTMSAYALAAELGLDVMKADISRIEDKYIGETEKRISEVFEKAEENNCLLFFDEADSLFARRTGVSDSHDRHANAQTAYLLQKMEEYGGIVVLSTNLGENIDPAFRRRLRFILEFQKPDAKTRAELWRRFIPENMPCEELDFDFLAGTFDLTPAEIKWSVLSAAVYADGNILSMRHILSALKYEYEKSSLAFPDISYKKIKLGGEQL